MRRSTGARGEEREPNPPFGLDREPQIQAGRRNEQQQVDRPVGQPAPQPDPEPVTPQIGVVRTRHLVQVGHRLQQSRRTLRNHRHPVREVDVDGRFEPRPGHRDHDALLAANVADESNLSGQSRLIHELPGAIGGLAATRDIESCRNSYVADGDNGGSLRRGRPWRGSERTRSPRTR